MSLSPTSPVVGTSMSGLTSPTYTLTLDSSAANVKQYAVTALGGTQTGVSVHSPSCPFFLAFSRPSQFKQVAMVDPSTGQLRAFPRNAWKLLAGKGVIPLAGQPSQNALFRAEFILPAGCETADANSLAAFLSFLGGFFAAESGDLLACFKGGLL